MIHRLDPPIPVRTTKGSGLAIFLRDYGIEHDDYWTVILDYSGEIWTFSNKQIRATQNMTVSREYISPFYEPSSVEFK